MNIPHQIDIHKIHKLTIPQITESELTQATVVLICSCGKEQSIDNDVCESCGKDIS